MRINYILIIIIGLAQPIISQTMKIFKNDKTTLDFTLSDIDSIKFSTSPTGRQVVASDWIGLTNSPVNSIIEPSPGIIEEVEEGLKVYGAANSVSLIPASHNSIMSKTIYLKWKVNGNGHNADIGVELYSEPGGVISVGRILNLSTKPVTSGSVSILDDKWYFTRISISAGNVVAVTSSDNYDNNGGVVISNSSLKISGNIETFSFQTNADKNAYSILGESRIE
jgi:adhesin HecA-like repeat protein